MKFKKILFLVFSLSLSLISFVNASELGGIKILQTSDKFIKNDDNEKRNRKYDENVKIYLNNSFNLSYEKIKNENNWSDFSIPSPDYFFDKYIVYEKNNQIIKIYSLRTLERNVPQDKFKVGECESLRDQLISEKFDLLNNVNAKDQQFTRVANNNKIIFKDRKIFKYRKNNNDIIHYLTCNYIIDYSDNEGEHLITNRIFEAIFLYDEFKKEENISSYKQVEKFNSNYIKNFKIWGNFNFRDYDTNEIYSLKKYRSTSFKNHQKLKELKDAKIKEKIKKEKEKQIVSEKINKFEKEIENKLILIQNKKLKLSEKINFLEKPVIDLENSFNKEIKFAEELISLVEDQQYNFKEKFRANYDDCFPKSINEFVKPYETVKAKLVLKDKTNFLNYGINYQAFNKADDKSLFYYDFVKNHTNCIVQLLIQDKYSTIDLNNIDLRFYNETGKFELKKIELNTSTKNKLFSLEEKITSLNRQLEDKVETISLEIIELENKYNSEVNIIKNQIVDIENQISNLYEKNKTLFSSSELLKPKVNNEIKPIKTTDELKKESVDPDEILKLIDKAKEDPSKEIKKNNDITQDQDKNIITSGLTLSEVDVLKAQIFGCWSIPLGLPYNENLLVKIKIELKPDGSIAKTEILDHARMNKPGQGFYKILAESALRAVKLCQPLRVPTTGYERWKTIIINFDVREMLGG